MQALVLWFAIAKSWLSSLRGYPRLPLSLHCIFYKGDRAGEAGFQLVSVLSVVTLGVKLLVLTMVKGGGRVEWQVHRLSRSC